MSHQERGSAVLPTSMPLLLCSRVQAAALLNVGPSTFDKLRRAHRLLRPVRLGARPVWPYKNLMAFVDELSDAEFGGDIWDDAAT